MEIEVRSATTEDIPSIVEVLAEASAWLKDRGIVQWPERFPADLLLRSIAAHELYVVGRDGLMAGTVTLQWNDAMFWGQRDDAGFLHRFAIARTHAGTGAYVLAWAEDQVILNGRRYLCLDTPSSNGELRRYYEHRGFSLVGEVAGPESRPHTAAHGRWQAALYEKRVAHEAAP